LLSVGSLPPLEPQVKQKPPEAVPADQAAASAAKGPVVPGTLVKPQVPLKPELGPVAKPEIRSEGKVPDKLDVPEPQPTPPAAEPVKKPARADKKSKKAPAKAEADGKEKKGPGEEGKEPAKGDAEAPTEDQQHAAAPSLAPGAICDELRRAARDRREDRIKLTQEREALGKERARLEALAEEIAQARASLKEETARLQAVIDKANEKAKGPAKPGAPLPAGKPTATGPGQSPSLADAGRK
jgi:hypothetical protein